MIDLPPLTLKLSPHILEPYQEQGNDQCQSKRYFVRISQKSTKLYIYVKAAFLNVLTVNDELQSGFYSSLNFLQTKSMAAKDSEMSLDFPTQTGRLKP